MERDTGDIGAGDLLQALYQQVIDRAETRDAITQLARVGASISNELAKGAGGHRGILEIALGHVGDDADDAVSGFVERAADDPADRIDGRKKDLRQRR